MSDVLELRGVRKRFDEVVALDGVDFSLRRGEWLGVLGPNGAGKSTVVRTVAGRVRPDEGEVLIHGEVQPAGSSALRKKLGIVPQEIALYGGLTARENLETFAVLHGVEKARLREKVEASLEWTALADRADEPVKHFSGGMQRRLNIACGILHDPEIILLDEPTAGVDPQSRERIWEMLSDLQKKGASLTLTTHQLDEAQQTCDRIVIIDHGKVIASGTLTELVKQTVGDQRQVAITLETPVPPVLLDQGFEPLGERQVRRTVTDVAVELPALLSALTDAGASVAELSIEQPSLQAVFIHLTGRELRE